jgi:hypothetical protein
MLAFLLFSEPAETVETSTLGVCGSFETLDVSDAFDVKEAIEMGLERGDVSAAGEPRGEGSTAVDFGLILMVDASFVFTSGMVLENCGVESTGRRCSGSGDLAS